MGYQEDCEDFERFGDPAREAFEYELNASADFVAESFDEIDISHLAKSVELQINKLNNIV